MIMTELDFKYIDMFITAFLVIFFLFSTFMICYLENEENKRIEESRRKRLEWREKRREGTIWETKR